MIDNTFFNNIYIIKIIDLIQLDLDLKKQKLWCIGHIINLIAKAFIFNNKSEIFEANITIAKNTNNLEAAIRL